MSSAAKSILDDGFITDFLPIQGKSIETRIGMLNHTQLHYYAENPRVYSIVREEGKHPTQEAIETKLQQMEHVRALVHDIKKHGGLIDPLVVKDGSFDVVEGNSRLAAYRLLAQQNPSKWAKVRVRLLPQDLDDDRIASLLGQWHLRGKKEWPAYEQAGYLYRRHKTQNVSFAALAAEAGGITATRVEKVVQAYELMVDQGDTKRDRWSYYEEFVKSRKIAKACEKQEGLAARVLKMVKEGKFERAQDLRDKLPVICDGPAKNLARFTTGKVDFAEAYEVAKDAGGDNTPLQKVRKFRIWLAAQAVQDSLAIVDGQARERLNFEVKKLQTLFSAILKKQ